MENSVLSELKFNSYFVDEMIFRRNPQFIGPELPKLKVDLTANIAVAKDNRQALVTLDCKMFDEGFVNSTSPFYLKTRLTGQFSCGESFDIEAFRPNAVAILLPYLRALISSFTAQSGIPPIILPPINVYNLLDNRQAVDVEPESNTDQPDEN